jgi:predicted O-linked N-acetylglucosamine transferase (SPINDLY family)
MHRGAWQEALDLLVTHREPAPIWRKVWRAKCLLRVGHFQLACGIALEVCELTPSESQGQREHARLLLARGLMKMGEAPAAMRSLAKSLQEAPDNAAIRKQLADVVLNVLGDWGLAKRLLAPLQDHPTWRRSVQAFRIQRLLYGETHNAKEQADLIATYGQRISLKSCAAAFEDGAQAHRIVDGPSARHRPRPRLGLISPLFQASAVYFLCIGALRHLAQDFDLIFFSRNTYESWSQKAFQSIATEWHDVSGSSPMRLATLLRQSELSAVMDMGGWLDLGALMALSTKPVRLQVKWVGGQSASMGVKAFDAFITDRHQTPGAAMHLHSEPIAWMPGGYVSYTPPPYMPEPRPTPPPGSPLAVGIVAHPKKLSPPFLAYLSQQVKDHRRNGGAPIKLEFVGRQYREPELQRRLLQTLDLQGTQEAELIQVAFKDSKDHLEHLTAIQQLDWIVDTFPYTGGLTALEALALGVPYRTHPGHHCAGRHAYSHALFAGLKPNEILLETLGAFQPGPIRRTGRTLLPNGCERLDHARLANDLARLLHRPELFMSAMS